MLGRKNDICRFFALKCNRAFSALCKTIGKKNTPTVEVGAMLASSSRFSSFPRRRESIKIMDPIDPKGLQDDKYYYSLIAWNVQLISTATFFGSAETPTAVRACFPFSPRICTASSLAPFNTIGWSWKSSADCTNP